MLGPVFRHEMLASGRRPRYTVLRVLIGLGMLALLGIGYRIVYEDQRVQRIVAADGATVGFDAGLSIAGTAMLTSIFYQQFAWATMLGVLAVTPAIAAGAIASERERRTIEYLFATDLSNGEIVLDKLAARLATVALLVLSTLPVLAIFRLLGGVPGDVLLRHFAILAVSATLTASLALTRGVWCERARDAVPAALSAVFVWLIAWPLAEVARQFAAFSMRPWAQALDAWLLSPLAYALRETHPLWTLSRSTGASLATIGIGADGWGIARSLFWQLLVAAVLLAFAVANVRRVHLTAAATPAKNGTAPGARGRRPAAGPFEARPMLWKELYAASVPRRGRPWVRRLAVALFTLLVASPLVGTIAVAIYTGNRRAFDEYMGVATGLSVACGTLVALLVGARAAGLVSHERERDTWVSLLATPLTARDILSAKAWGNLHAFRWPFAGVIAMPLLGAFFEARAIAAALGVAAVLATVGWAATWIGLTASIRCAGSLKAVGVATFAMIAIGGLYSGLSATMVALSGVDDEVFPVLVLPPLVPMLLAAPSLMTFESGDGWFSVVLVLGVGFYAALGFALRMGAITQFDRLCERGEFDPTAVSRTSSAPDGANTA